MGNDSFNVLQHFKTNFPTFLEGEFMDCSYRSLRAFLSRHLAIFSCVLQGIKRVIFFVFETRRPSVQSLLILLFFPTLSETPQQTVYVVNRYP